MNVLIMATVQDQEEEHHRRFDYGSRGTWSLYLESLVNCADAEKAFRPGALEPVAPMAMDKLIVTCAHRPRAAEGGG